MNPKQKKTLAIPKKIFKALVKELQDKDKKIYWYNNAYDALQTDTEEYIVDMFTKASKLAQLSKNKTLHIHHIKNIGKIYDL